MEVCFGATPEQSRRGDRYPEATAATLRDVSQLSGDESKTTAETA
jgi:hypothetical protein